MHYIGHRESTYVMVNVTHLSTTSIEYYYVSEKVAFWVKKMTSIGLASGKIGVCSDILVTRLIKEI